MRGVRTGERRYGRGGGLLTGSPVYLVVGRCGINCSQFLIFLSTFPWHPPVPPLRDMHPGINPAFKTKAGTPPMTFARMSSGFVCSSQRDKERDLNKSIYPHQQSTQPPFVWSAAQCCAPAGTMQCPGNPRAPRASLFPSFWEGFGRLCTGCISLGPQPEGHCWAPVRGRDSPCQMVAVDGHCSLGSSSLLPFPAHHFFSKLAPVGFWATSSQEWSVSFFPFARQQHTSECPGLEGFMHPQGSSTGFLQPELCW